MANLFINNKYNIKLKDKKIFDFLKSKEYYYKFSREFLQTFTDLSIEEIIEITKDEELKHNVIDVIYNHYDLNNEQTFISTLNYSIETFNKVETLFVTMLVRGYDYKLENLINKTSKELMTLFLLESKSNPNEEMINTCCESLKAFYSEKTIEDFKSLLIRKKTNEELKEEFNKELAAFSQM